MAAQGGLGCFGEDFEVLWMSFVRVLGSSVYMYEKIPINRSCGRYAGDPFNLLFSNCRQQFKYEHIHNWRICGYLLIIYG